MLFNSIPFLIFLPIVLIVFFSLNKKHRNIWLLIASYYFYMNWNASYALLIFTSTVATYFSSILIHKFSNKKKPILVLCVLINLAILFFYKYYNFFARLITDSLNTFNYKLEIDRLDILLPVGISFYTFQAISYTADVYRGDIEPETNFIRYALFVSFFPQLVAGPIERSSRLLPQFVKHKDFGLNRLKSGALLMLWGFFKKVVIADYLALLVNQVYNNPSEHYGFSVILATIFFTIQIYCDFSGYSDIAIGCARIMGIDLMKNFDNPYFSKSITEFWRRWHISLSTWFRDYLYIPLGGNKKGVVRTYVNIFIVFLVSGLWHGASLTFVLWGAIHGIVIIVERLVKPYANNLYDKLNWNLSSFSYALYKNIIVLVIVVFAWLFFRANSISDAILLVKNMAYLRKDLDWIYSLNFKISAFVAIILLFLVEYMNSKHSIIQFINKQNVFFRWSLYIVILFFILIFGTYGQEETTFIYFQF